MDLKDTAKRLLKLADQIEREASDNSYFVCDNCNHTASLSEINDRRIKLASEEDPDLEVQAVTVNDRVKCAACEGIMVYVPSDDSERYYVTAEDEVEEETEEETEEKTEEETEEMPSVEENDKGGIGESESPAEGDEKSPKDVDVDIDKLFEDVETQAQKSKGEEEEAPGEDIPEQPTPEDDTSSALPPEEPRQEESPAGPSSETEEEPIEEKAPKKEEAPAPEEEEAPAPESEIEEEIIEEEPAEKPKSKPKKKKDKPDDGKANWEKEEVPQFKSKEAIERFASSFERYSL
jgi:hypothetical protein